MIWIKKGLLYVNREGHEWCKSHASFPFAFHLGEDQYRIYFAPRDSKGRSHITWIEVDVSKEPWQIVREVKRAVLSPGPPGTFDDNGAHGSCIIGTGNGLYLYYVGWNLGVSVPFRASIGLAVSEDGGLSFQKISQGPIMDRSIADPILLGTGYIIVQEGRWRMWYGSGSRWDITSNGPKHYYNIRHAWSEDGIRWETDGHVCIDYANQWEYAISRPSVLIDNDGYRMWYTFRGSKYISTYRIGYAESNDGLDWVRKDNHVGLDVSQDGWDSEMICYPFVFKHKGHTFMIYNGNGFGKTGFGYAEMEE